MLDEKASLAEIRDEWSMRDVVMVADAMEVMADIQEWRKANPNRPVKPPGVR